MLSAPLLQPRDDVRKRRTRRWPWFVVFSSSICICMVQPSPYIPTRKRLQSSLESIPPCNHSGQCLQRNQQRYSTLCGSCTYSNPGRPEPLMNSNSLNLAEMNYLLTTPTMWCFRGLGVLIESNEIGLEHGLRG